MLSVVNKNTSNFYKGKILIFQELVVDGAKTCQKMGAKQHEKGRTREARLQQISGDGWSGVRCKQVGEPQLFGNLLFRVVIQNNFSREFLRIDEEIVTIAQVQL